MAHPLAPIWPPARLRITTPRLELRLPTEEEIVRLVAAAQDGVHDPADMPFASPWTDEEPDKQAPRIYAWHAHNRGAFTATSWTLLLAVFVDGEPVGAQDVIANRFATRREVDTGSWLARSAQGRGLGTEMREAALHFAFAGLGALAANSGAYEDNAASNRVSEKVGYHRNGINIVVRSRGPRAPGGASQERALEHLYRMDRASWRERRRDDIEVRGLDDELRAMLGATDTAD
jgi:RimJ/RimL family protein N-acetyltransferase